VAAIILVGWATQVTGVHHMVFDVLTNDVPEIEATIKRFAQEVRPPLA